MPKTTGRSKGSPSLKLFRPMSWYDVHQGYVVTSAGEYVSHIFMELGRLGLELSDIERHLRPPNTETVLSDLVGWFDETPGKALSNLLSWQLLDFGHLRSRLEHDPSAKPRIEVSAHITKMNNLSVRWHPGGWQQSVVNWEYSGRHSTNLIPQRRWRVPPDFRWFTGDEAPTFDSRPTNELMYIRGVGNLRPLPTDDRGPYATFNSDVLDSLLICAVRAAFEGLVAQLGQSFEVNAINAFDFVTRDETDNSDQWACTVHRVVSWQLENAAELQARKDAERAADQETKDQSAFEEFERTNGFDQTTFVSVLGHASKAGARGAVPSAEQANRLAAKELRNRGFPIDAGHVRRLRYLVERYSPEMLPEALRPIPSQILKHDNVVRLFESGD